MSSDHFWESYEDAWDWSLLKSTTDEWPRAPFQYPDDSDLEFVSFDTEGADDAAGRHHTTAVIMGDKVLYDKGRPISSLKALRWISKPAFSEAPSNVVYVGFHLGYDFTMLLRDMVHDSPAIARMLVCDDSLRRFAEPVTWRGLLIDTVPGARMKLRVARAYKHSDGQYRWTVIHDMGSFFQGMGSLHVAARTMGVVSDEEFEALKGMKEQRGDFANVDWAEIKRYALLESVVTTRMAERLRDRFVSAGLSGLPYEGPGQVAGRVLGVQVLTKPVKKAVRRAVPDEVHALSPHIVCGARIEATAFGPIDRRVYHYDIRSAYPSAMSRVPCLIHTQWRYATADDFRKGRVSEPLWIGRVKWTMPSARTRDIPYGTMGPAPWRNAKRDLKYPVRGQSWLWSFEAPAYGDVQEGWVLEQSCDCVPLGYIPEMYAARQAMEREHKGSGMAYKLVLNSTYGKLVQTIGTMPYRQPLWGSFILADTRARLYDVYKAHPRKVVMMHTDSVFLTEPAPELDCGPALGQWEECEPLDGLHLLAAGIYFTQDRLYAGRGVPLKELSKRLDDLCDLSRSLDFKAKVTVPDREFINVGNHLNANMSHTPEDWSDKQRANLDRIGNWYETTYSTGFAGNNRDLTHRLWPRNGAYWSKPPLGDREVLSRPADKQDVSEVRIRQIDRR